MLKKLLVPICVLLSGLTACSSCSKPNDATDANIPETPCTASSCSTDASPDTTDASTESDVLVDVNPVDKTITGALFELTVPYSWEEQKNTDPNIKVILTNTTTHNMLALIVVPDNNYEGYVLSAIRGIKDSGAKISTATTVEINGIKFTLIEAIKAASYRADDVVIWNWLTVQNGYGYGLICAGLNSDRVLNKEVCTKIVNSLKIK